jgi:hypothetical protein
MWCIESRSSRLPDHDLRTHVAQRLRASVFISHHRTHRLPCFNSSSVTVRPTTPARPAAPVTRMGFAMFSARSR